MVVTFLVFISQVLTQNCEDDKEKLSTLQFGLYFEKDATRHLMKYTCIEDFKHISNWIGLSDITVVYNKNNHVNQTFDWLATVVNLPHTFHNFAMMFVLCFCC